jgi:hypothetical protein
MRALKLIQMMQSNSVTMSEELVQKIRSSEKCRELLLRVPESDQKQYAREIYRDLTEWLSSETDSIIERRYFDLGAHRASQGVPLSQILWAVSISREHLWEYTQQECLHEEPVEFWGGVMLLRSLNRFFDNILYFALTGYEKAGTDEAATLSFLASRRSA